MNRSLFPLKPSRKRPYHGSTNSVNEQVLEPIQAFSRIESHVSQPRDAGPVLLFFIAIVVAGLHSVYLFPGGPSTSHIAPWPLIRDEGTVLYDSLRVAHGQVPYRDFFEFQAPVFYLLYGLVFSVTGASMVAARALQIAVTTLCAGLIASVVSHHAGRLSALGCAFFYAFAAVPLWPMAYPHWLAATFGVGAIALLLFHPKKTFWAGLLLGLGSATIQSTAGLAVVSVFVAGSSELHFGWRVAMRRVFMLLTGIAVPWLILILGFAFHGALDDLLYCIWTWPREQYAKGNADALSYATFTSEYVHGHDSWVPRWRELAQALLWAVPAAPVASLFALVAAVPLFLYRTLTMSVMPKWIGTAILSAAAVLPLFSGHVRSDIVHVAFLEAFGLLGLSSLMPPLFRHIVATRIFFALLCGAFGIAAVATFCFKWKVSPVSAPSFRAQFASTAEEFLSVRDVFRKTEHDSTANGSVVVSGMEGFFYFFVRDTCIRNTALPWHIGDDYLSEEQWNDIAARILSYRPSYMGLVDYQWQKMTHAEPRLLKMYKREGYFFTLLR